MPATGERGIADNVARMRRVLTEVAQKADWGRKKFVRGRGQGIAFHFSHRGYIAEVAEVTVSRAGVLKLIVWSWFLHRISNRQFERR